MDSIEKQFDSIMEKQNPVIDSFIMKNLENFGEEMVNNIIPIQRGFYNLTGNTITSFAYGLYLDGELLKIGLYDGKNAIRTKLTKGELFEGISYDGKYRRFVGIVSTDGDYGTQTSINFLKSYSVTSKYGIVFTTGTEYSEYLEKVVNVNVLTDGRIYSISSFINSFKKI